MQKRKLDKNPNLGKRHNCHASDPRKNANYAHSNLIRMGVKDHKAVSVTVDPSRKGTARKAYNEFIGTAPADSEFRVFG